MIQPDGELAESMRYLSQRYSMPNRKVAGLLTGIGTEELAHMEMVSAIVHQLTKDLTPAEIQHFRLILVNSNLFTNKEYYYRSLTFGERILFTNTWLMKL